MMSILAMGWLDGDIGSVFCEFNIVGKLTCQSLGKYQLREAWRVGCGSTFTITPWLVIVFKSN